MKIEKKSHAKRQKIFRNRAEAAVYQLISKISSQPDMKNLTKDEKRRHASEITNLIMQNTLSADFFAKAKTFDSGHDYDYESRISRVTQEVEKLLKMQRA